MADYQEYRRHVLHRRWRRIFTTVLALLMLVLLCGVWVLWRQLYPTPPARDARVCKAEARRDCLCGTILTPRSAKSGTPIAFGYLLTGDRVVMKQTA